MKSITLFQQHTYWTRHWTSWSSWTFKTSFALCAAQRVYSVCILSWWTGLWKRAAIGTGVTFRAIQTLCCPSKWVLSRFGTWSLSFLRCPTEVPRSTPDADCAVVTGDFSRITADWQLVTWFTDLSCACIGTLCTRYHWKNVFSSC